MKTRPILMSAPMIRAILDETKTQTRRVGKLQDPEWTELGVEYSKHATKGLEAVATYRAYPEGGTARHAIYACPYGIPGDRLWVKETHLPKASGLIYRADYDPVEAAGLGGMYGGWKPSIFCRREYSRITLEITEIRCERLNKISDDDAQAEGIFLNENDWWDCGNGLRGESSPWAAYQALWETINGPGSWAKNPWVWVITFRKL